MDDELRSRLRNLVEGAPEGTPDFDAVARAGRTSRRKVIAALSGISFVVVLGSVYALMLQAGMPNRGRTEIVDATPERTFTPHSGSTPAPEGSQNHVPPTPDGSIDCVRRPVAGKCNERQWAIEVAEEAGFSVDEQGGGGLDIQRSFWTFQFNAFVPESKGDRRPQLRDENYEPVGEINGVKLFSDGLRLTWEVSGLYVWLSGVDGIDASTGGVERIVRTSLRVPYARPTCTVDDCGESEGLVHAARWLGGVLKGARLEYVDNYRKDGGGGHMIRSEGLFIWTLRRSEASAKEEAARWNYPPLWTADSVTVFGYRRSGSPVGYLYWRTGETDTVSEVEWYRGRRFEDLRPVIIRIIREQQENPYPGT